MNPSTTPSTADELVAPGGHGPPGPGAPHPSDLLTFWELSTDLLSIAEPTGTFLYVNPAWTRALGWTREQMLETSAIDLVHPDDLEATAAVLDGLARPGYRVDDFENRYRTSDGDHRRLRWNARTGMDGRVYSVTRDVTEVLENERRLLESEERFRLSMTHAAIGMALVALDGTFLEVNEALCRILGRPCDVLTTCTFQDLTHPDDLDADLELVRQLAAGEIDRYDLEKRYFHADGSTVWALLSGSAVRDGTGAARYYIAQIQDITDRKQAEWELRRTLTELERSNATLTDFAAIAAHDLKTPLAVSASMLELLAMRFSGDLPDQGRELVDRSRRQLKRLGRQVDGLLGLAAVTSMTIDLERVDLARAVDSLTEVLGHALGGLDVEVGAAPPMLADQTGLVLLLQNLLANAAGHGARRVQIHAQPRADGMIQVFVDDDGPGIDIDDRESAFELFQHGGPGAGTGLGLATCRRVVERHGGDIGIDESPLGGARLWFTLPAGTPEETPQGEAGDG